VRKTLELNLEEKGGMREKVGKEGREGDEREGFVG
jgi:hypothetical protein